MIEQGAKTSVGPLVSAPVGTPIASGRQVMARLAPVASLGIEVEPAHNPWRESFKGGRRARRITGKMPVPPDGGCAPSPPDRQDACPTTEAGA